MLRISLISETAWITTGVRDPDASSVSRSRLCGSRWTTSGWPRQRSRGEACSLWNAFKSGRADGKTFQLRLPRATIGIGWQWGALRRHRHSRAHSRRIKIVKPSPAPIPTDYKRLVQTRKACRLCPKLLNRADSSHAEFDGDEVGPWSRWLAGRPAKILIVGQDWGTFTYYREHEGRDTPDNLTNRRLVMLLRELGFQVPEVSEHTERSTPVFLTNAILCLKPGDTMSAAVKSGWFDACGPMLKATVAAVGA